MYQELGHVCVHFVLCFYQKEVLDYGAISVSLIIHAKDMMHTCITKFTCMKPNSRARKKKNLYSQKPIYVHKIKICIHKLRFTNAKHNAQMCNCAKNFWMFKIYEFILDCECEASAQDHSSSHASTEVCAVDRFISVSLVNAYCFLMFT